MAYRGDYSRLLTLAHADLRQGRAIQDSFETARALILLSAILDTDHNDEAIHCGEEALVLAQEIGNPSYLSWAPMMLAGRLATSDPVRARQLLDEAATAAALAENDYARSMAMQQLAFVQAKQGDYFLAGRSVLGMIRHARDGGDHGSVLSGLATLACLFAVLGDEEPALVTAAWVADHGMAVAQTINAYMGAFGAARLTAMQERQADTGGFAVQRLARSLDEARAIAYVADQLDQHVESARTSAPS
jgi:hypothetical protein